MSFYSQSDSQAAGTNHRRTWDETEYSLKAHQRALDEKEAEDIRTGKKKKDEPKMKREMLQAREYKVDLDSKVGKSVVITKATPSAETGGFYCDVCDCVVKDSINFLDHINGKNHQRNIGMSMKTKKSTVNDVRERFRLLKEKKEREKKEQQVEQLLEDVQEEEARMADFKKEKKTDTRKRKRDKKDDEEEEEEDDDGLDPEIRAMMGFSGFSTSKR
uniref:U1-type domain-containing protein n=1 Tax=Caenorhabditis japonica TaxID=281687 RepID=A0A8R1I030_CAEJA